MVSIFKILHERKSGNENRNQIQTRNCDTSACFKSSAWVRRWLSMFCTACPSTDILTLRALTRAWTRTRACMHRNVTAACFLTSLPRTRAWSLTTPFNALSALLACKFNQKENQFSNRKKKLKCLTLKLLLFPQSILTHISLENPLTIDVACKIN